MSEYFSRDFSTLPSLPQSITILTTRAQWLLYVPRVVTFMFYAFFMVFKSNTCDLPKRH